MNEATTTLTRAETLNAETMEMIFIVDNHHCGIFVEPNRIRLILRVELHQITSLVGATGHNKSGQNPDQRIDEHVWVTQPFCWENERRTMLDRIKAFVFGREVQVCVAAVLFGALADWPYGYFQFLRWVVSTGAVYCALKSTQVKKTWWIVGFAGIALLFNPIQIVHFRRSEWLWIDIIVALVFLIHPPTRTKTR